MSKKIFVLSLLSIALFCSTSFTKDFDEIKYMIKHDLENNYQSIQLELQDYTQLERSMIYQDLRLRAGGPIILNIIPGFGIGSFIHGDRKGGWLQLTANVVGLSMAFGGIAMFGNTGTDMNTWDARAFTGYFMAFGGAILNFAAQAYGIIRPIVYSKRSNNKLHKVLNEKSISLHFSPYLEVNPDDNRTGLQLSLRY